MNKKIIKLCTPLLVVSLLTGCGIQNKAKPKVETPKTEISFSWWGNDDRHAYTMDGVDLFQQKFPEINVSYRYGEWAGFENKNRVWMKSRTQADVMQINYAWINTYSPTGEGYYDLYQLKDIIDLDSFDARDLSYGEQNGKLNGIPIAFNTSTFWFNKKIFEKYNLEYPKTWDDFFAVAKVLREDNIYVLGVPDKHLFLMMIAYYEQTVGKYVFNEDGTLAIDQAGIEYLLKFYKRMIDEKVLIPIDKFDRMKFVDGTVAGSAFWISDADNYCSALEEAGGEAEVSSYPVAPNAKLSGLYTKPATMYAINSITEHPKEAAKLLNYLLTNKDMIELQGTEKGVPACKDAVKILKENKQLDTYGYKANLEMENVKDKMNNMIPTMENTTAIDGFKSIADGYIYDVKGLEATAKEIYEALSHLDEE